MARLGVEGESHNRHAPRKYHAVTRSAPRPFVRTLLPFGLAALAGAGCLAGRSRPADERITRGPFLQLPQTGRLAVCWRTRATERGAVTLTGPGGRTEEFQEERATRDHRIDLPSLTAGATYTYQVRGGAQRRFSAPAAPGQPFRFVAFGDSGTGSKAQRAVGERTAALRPALVLILGDVNYNSGREQDLDPHVFTPFRDSMAESVYVPVLGNHDYRTRKGKPLLDAFHLPRNGPAEPYPEANFSFDYGDAHIVGVNSEATERATRDTIVPWLDADLRATRQRWKVVYLHRPPFSSGHYGEDAKIKRTLVPVFERHQVDLVLSGHDHNYQRNRPIGGVLYLVSGAGSARFYPKKHPQPYNVVFDHKNYGVTSVDVSPDAMAGQQVTVTGKTIDRWNLDAATRRR